MNKDTVTTLYLKHSLFPTKMVFITKNGPYIYLSVFLSLIAVLISLFGKLGSKIIVPNSITSTIFAVCMFYILFQIYKAKSLPLQDWETAKSSSLPLINIITIILAVVGRFIA